jgi:hypothetical protein
MMFRQSMKGYIVVGFEALVPVLPQFGATMVLE